MAIGIEILEADALKIKADVLVLKYAQDFFFGADSMAFSKLALLYKNLERKLPNPHEFLFLEGLGSAGADYILFAGVEGLSKFRYKEIRGFSFNALRYLAETKADTEHICFTMHGANYGLDEAEAFESEIAGMVEAIARGLYPAKLKRISIAEIYEPRAIRLRATLKELFPEGVISVENRGGISERSIKTVQLSQAGINSDDKPLIFVAMPFDKRMDDTFHYGIRNAVNNAGFLCERIDEVVFTGDILDLIKRRYAWGLGIPTVLIVQDAQELKFDVKGQKCIIYSGIRELEEKLSRELLGLR